jgi:hypothetical protein
MAYVITNHERVITEQFETEEDLNNFILSAQEGVPEENSGSNQYVRIDDEEMNSRFNNSDEIGKPFFYFIYTTEQFENLSGV